jgi:hypothetical protein
MSFPVTCLQKTNLPAEYIIMDDHEDGKDIRYYCLPPYYGTPGHKGGGILFISFHKDIGWGFLRIGERARKEEND